MKRARDPASYQLTSTPAWQEPVAGATAPCLSSPRIKAGSRPRANRGRGLAAYQAIAWWLRRALAGPARAWALAAGVPPDLYP